MERNDSDNSMAALAARMEAEDYTPAAQVHQPTAEQNRIHGEQFAAVAAEMLASRGRPSVGHGNATGRGASPRHQVVLSQDQDRRLRTYMETHRMSASAVLRAGLQKLLDERRRGGRLR